jgi:hypothetical protein
MRGPQPHEHMHMIRNAAHRVSNSIQTADNPSEVCVKPRALFFVENAFTVLRAENDVVMK